MAFNDTSLRLVVQTTQGQRDLVVGGLDADDLVDDLVALLRPTEPGHLVVDERPVAPGTSLALAGVGDGSVLAWNCSSQPEHHTDPPSTPTAALTQVAGTGSGRSCSLTAGQNVVASHDGDVLVRVDIDDRGGGRIRLGSPGAAHRRLEQHDLVPGDRSRVRAAGAVFEIGPPRAPDSHSASPARTEVWARPPRRFPPPVETDVHVPAASSPPQPAPAMSWIAALAPLPIAVVMAVAYRPLFALFGLMAPIVAIARWREGRRRHRRDSTRWAESESSRIHAVQAAADRRREEGEVRLRHQQPDIGRVLTIARHREPALWERRRSHSDFGVATVGMADVPVVLDPSGPDRSATVLPDEVDLGVYRSVPITVDITAGPVGLVGPRRRTLALARALLIDLTVASGPSDLRLDVAVAADRLSHWDWLKWLPHLIAPPDSGDETLSLTIVDGDTRFRPNRPRATALAVAASIDELPDACTTVVELRGSAAIVLDTTTDTQVNDVTPVLLGNADTESAARSICGVFDPDLIGAAGSIPSHVAIDALLPGCEIPDDIAQRWATAGSDPDAFAVLGAGPDGVPVGVDLDIDGPHALVAGTTGSGKSELLRTLVVGLAVANPPDALAFVLIDYKGGGAFDTCRELPHVVDVVTDLDDHLAGRALHALRCELRRREEVLRRSGAHDARLHRRLGGHLPRLVVVVDEFATLAGELPDFLDALVDMAQRGRSLGIHLVLATQRPAGVLDNKIRANTDLRLCLRVQDDNDSIDVLGSPDAARLPRSTPGRALLRTGPGALVEFQAAVTTSPSARPDPQPTWAPFTLARALRPPDADSTDPLDTSDAAPASACVAAVRSAADRLSLPEPRRLWEPPLPARLPSDHLPPPPTSAGPHDIVVGLADGIDTRDPVLVDISENAVIVGMDSDATADALTTVALAAAQHDAVDLYVVHHHPHPLWALGSLPTCGAVVAADDDESLRRLADRLSLSGDDDTRRSLLVVDGLDRLLSNQQSPSVDGAGTLASRFHHILETGSRSGVAVIGSAASDRSLSPRVLNHIGRRLIMRLADPNGYLTFGLPSRSVPPLNGHQAVDPDDGRHVVLAHHDDIDSAVRRISSDSTRSPDELPSPLPTLATVLESARIGPTRLTGRRRLAPIAVSTETLDVVELELATVTPVIGPPGSGRTTTVRAIAAAFEAADHRSDIVAIGDRDHLAGAIAHDTDPSSIGTPAVLLIDDMELLSADLAQHVSEVIRGGRSTVVIAGSTAGLADPMSPLRVLRGAAHGILLCPRAGDSEPFRISVPRSSSADRTPGSGLLIDTGHPHSIRVIDPACCQPT